MFILYIYSLQLIAICILMVQSYKLRNTKPQCTIAMAFKSSGLGLGTKLGAGSMGVGTKGDVNVSTIY